MKIDACRPTELENMLPDSDGQLGFHRLPVGNAMTEFLQVELSEVHHLMEKS